MVTTVRRVGIGGLTTMAAVLIAAAIWPAVATYVALVLAVVVGVAVVVPGALALRWGRRELSWRRELRVMPPTSAESFEPAAVVPTLHELRESA